MRICYVPSDMDAPGFYRCLSPGRQLSEHGQHVFMPPREVKKFTDDEGKSRQRHIFDVNLMLPQKADIYVWQQWKERVLVDGGIDSLHRWGSKVVIDVDDNYVNLPEYNPAFYGTHPYKRDDGVILNRAKRRELGKRLKQKIEPNKHNYLHMLEALRQADLVTVSTPFLAEVYAPYSDNIRVVRNYVDWDIWEDITPQYEVERERIRIGYYGVFKYRRGDLALLQRVLPRFLRDHPEVDFVTNSEETHVFLDVPEGQRITLGEYDFYDHDTNEYQVGKMTAHCDIGLIPMLQNDLNRGKSHLKGMEYNAAGIPFIASPLDSYTDYWCRSFNNGLIANDEGEWYNAMEILSRNHFLRKNMGQCGRADAEHNSIQKNWHHWYDVYSELLDG